MTVECGNSGRAIVMELSGSDGAVRYSAEEVHCGPRNEPAVISVVAREGARGRPMCFVLWCSLRAIGQCDEQCLRATARAA